MAASRSRGAFTIDADYPDALLGSGSAPSPGQLFLASLGSSFVTSFVLAAAAANVRIEAMRVHALTRGPRSAYVELRVEVNANASPARLEEFIAAAMERSPVVALCRFEVQAILETGPNDRGAQP